MGRMVHGHLGVEPILGTVYVMSDLKNFILDEAENVYIPLGEANPPAAKVDVVARIHGVLTDRTKSGAVITGVAGDGRQRAFETAFDLLQDRLQLVRLNGTRFVSQVPRGALSFLVSKLELGTEASRHELVHGLAELLCPEGRPAVLLLGHPELIDEQSASVLSQLSAMRKIVLIVLCRRPQDLPQDILSLYRSGQLTRINMPSMNLAQARSCLEVELGGPLSTFAVATLRSLTNTNRDLMFKLARLWLAEGQLEQHGGVWILRSGVLKIGPALNSMLNMMLSGVEEPERKLLFTMAIGGPIPVEILQRNGLARQLDQLCESGHIHIIHHPLDQAHIGIPLLALLLREVLDDDLKLTLQAELASMHKDPAAAQTRATLRAMTDQGETIALLEVAEAFRVDGYSTAAWLREPEHRIAILGLHVKTLLTLNRVPEAAAVLGDAGAGICDGQQYPGVADRIELAKQELELLRVRVLMAGDGHATASDIRQTLKALVTSTEWHSESQHYRALAAQAVGWAAQKRQMDALAAVDQITSELGILKANGQFEAIFSTEDAVELEMMLLQTELLAGSWRAASLRAQLLAGDQVMNPRIAASADAVRGILLGLFDEPERALKILVPVLQQLAFTPKPEERAAVEAVATYALVATGENAEAIELLLKEPDAARTMLPLNFLSWVAETFSSLAVARINEPNSAHARLVAFADKVHGAGYAGLEMQTLAVALRIGNFDATDRFEQVARECQGQLALQYADLAFALRHRNAATLLGTLERLAESGQMLLSVPSPNALIDALEPREQRRLATLVARLKRRDNGVHRVPVAGNHPNKELPSWATGLTKRESQVALLAIDGQGNSEIARNSGVSVRTVEGHLYQVYSKLQVRNRQELTALDRTTRSMLGEA